MNKLVSYWQLVNYNLSSLCLAFQCLLPLQPLRGSFPRVQAALGELASLAQNLVCQRGQVRSSLLDGIQEALTQFRNHTLSLKQVRCVISGCK